MSKIGRKPIELNGVDVTINGQELTFKGSLRSGAYVLPEILVASQGDGKVSLSVQTEGASKKALRSANRLWGLHRALLANTIYGAHSKFVKGLQIVGLGYKVAIQGEKLLFSLGYSHKINFDLPDEVEVEIDKTGQKVTLKSSHRDILGDVAARIRNLRKPEPYKGTGIRYADEIVFRKAGKK